MGCHLPGFRFFPTEQELLDFYLPNKLKNQRPDMERVIPVVDVYDYDPSHLPCISSGEARLDNEEMFFFCPRQRQEAHGGRPKRTTPSGYWKATGSPTQVIHNNRVIGKKKTMVFYEGKAPTGRKTSWKMNEYKTYEEQSSGGETRKLRSEFSICRIHKTSGCQRSFDRRPIVAVAQEKCCIVMEEWVAAAAVGTPSNHDSICVKSAAVKEAPEVAMSWVQSVLSPAEHPKEIDQEGTVEAVVDDDTDLNLLLAFGEDVVSLFEFEPLL